MLFGSSSAVFASPTVSGLAAQLEAAADADATPDISAGAIRRSSRRGKKRT